MNDRETLARAQAGDAAALETLLIENEGLCRQWAGRWSQGNRQEMHEDLMQEARLGLMRAIERLDLTRATAFSTYATWWIRQAVTRYAMTHEHLIYIPVYIGESRAAVRRAIAHLESDGQDATDEAVSAATGVSCADVATLRWSQRPLLSLNHVLDDGGDELGDHIPAPVADQDESDPDEIDALWDAVSGLTEREELTIILRFGLDGQDGRTLAQCSAQIGVSRERIRQHEVVALRKLRAALHRDVPELVRRRERDGQLVKGGR